MSRETRLIKDDEQALRIINHEVPRATAFVQERVPWNFTTEQTRIAIVTRRKLWKDTDIH